MSEIQLLSEIWLCQSTHIYLKNNPAKFHLNSIWNDRALGFLKKSPKKKNKQQQQDEQDE